MRKKDKSQGYEEMEGREENGGMGEGIIDRDERKEGDKRMILYKGMTGGE